MSTGESWWDYVQRVSAHAANKDIAAAAQMDASAISRWKRGDKPRAENVVAFARGYNRPAVEALLAAGYLTEQDITIMGAVPVIRSTREIPNSELIEEMQRRLAVGDPRRIEPGSSDDVFPDWSDDKRGRRRV